MEAAWLASDHAGRPSWPGSPWSAPAAAAPSATGATAPLPGPLRPPGTPRPAARRFALGIQGDWAGAAARWGARRPLRAGLELAASGRQPELLEALATLDRLDAVAAANLVRRDLRRMGVSHVPGRPRPRTRANPAGLTDRQLEVLELLAEGLTNAEIADRLVVSVRTVDHHVAAILAKLNVGSRREAARAAADLSA